jgi:hypothetical protein
MAVRVPLPGGDQGQRWPGRLEQLDGRGGPAAVVGDLEDVEPGEAALDEHRVDRLLGITGEQDAPPVHFAQHDDRGVVDRHA